MDTAKSTTTIKRRFGNIIGSGEEETAIPIVSKQEAEYNEQSGYYQYRLPESLHVNLFPKSLLAKQEGAQNCTTTVIRKPPLPQLTPHPSHQPRIISTK